jgi:hypothetical protein
MGDGGVIPKVDAAWPGTAVCTAVARGGRSASAIAVAVRAVRGQGAADEAVVLEEDLSDEEAGCSAGPVKWVVPACVGGTGSGPRGVEGRAEETESERK